MKDNKYTIEDIDTLDKFKKWYYRFFGPICMMYGFAVEEDGTPKRYSNGELVTTKLTWTWKRCENQENPGYKAYKMNMLRCVNGEPMIFENEEDFQYGCQRNPITSKYWCFVPDFAIMKAISGTANKSEFYSKMFSGELKDSLVS